MFIKTFLLGVLVGILANQVFAMITRALPQEWVRYKVCIEPPEMEKALNITDWFVPVKISPPSWYRRTLMSTLAEYLTVEIKIDDNNWVKTNWDKGDCSEYMLLANGVMTIPAILLHGSSACLYLGNMYGDSDYEVNQAKKIYVKVIRSLDKTIADMICIPVLSLLKGDISFGKVEHIKPLSPIKKRLGMS